MAPDVDYGAACTCHWTSVGYPKPVGGCACVTHDFGHLGDVLTIVYSSSQQEPSPEKSGIYLLLENIFSR